MRIGHSSISASKFLSLLLTWQNTEIQNVKYDLSYPNILQFIMFPLIKSKQSKISRPNTEFSSLNKPIVYEQLLQFSR